MPAQVKDRRKYRRIPRSREVAVFHYNDARDHPALVRGRLSDISAGGAAVQATLNPDMGSRGELKIQFEGFQLVSAAKVVRSWSGGFAVEFTDLDEAVREEVDHLPDDA